MVDSSQNITINVDVLDRYLGLSQFQTQFELYFQQFEDQNFLQLKKFFDEEQFFLQTNYLIQYQYYNNLMIQSNIFNEIVKNMTSDKTKLIKAKLLIILQLSSVQELEIFFQNKIDQLAISIDNQINMQNGQQYFNQLQINKEQYDLLEILNFYILQQNYKNPRLLRMLMEEKDNQQLNVLQNFNKIGNLLLKQQFPNEKKIEYLFESFHFSTAKVTNKLLNKTQIQIDLVNNTFLQIQELRLTYNDMTQELQQFKFLENTYQMQMYNIKFNNDTQLNQIDDGFVLNEFQMEQNHDYDQNFEYQCVIYKNQNWQENQCTTIIESNKIQCQCQDVELTSIKQVFINFKSNLYYIFSEKNFENIQNLNYFEVTFMYVQLFLTIIYIWFLFYGKKLDQVQILPQQNKVFPIDKQTEIELQKIKILDNNENRQNYNYAMRINITSNQQTLRALKEIQSDMCTPKSSSDVINQNEDREKEIFNIQKNTSIINEEKVISIVDVKTNSTSSNQQFLEVFSKFYKNYHKILALYFKYDQNQSRPFRATLLYLSLLGQMSFINWFGEIYDPITLITLSLLSYIFGLVYKKLLACFISSEIILLQYIGFLTASLSVIFFIFVTISTVPLYQNIFICNLWAVSYLVTVLVDLIFYTTLQILIMFLLLMKFRQNQTFQKILKRLLDPVCFAIIFAVSFQT